MRPWMSSSPTGGVLRHNECHPPLSKGLYGDEEMIAQYWDETKDVLVEEIVSGWPAFLELVRRTETGSSGRGAPAIELSDDKDMTCIFIRFEGGGCTVAIGGPEGLSWPADFNDDICEYVHYDYFGSWSEVPANLAIPREKALAAVKSFLETGNIPSSVLPLVRE